MAICWERAIPLSFHLCCFYFSARLNCRCPFPVWCLGQDVESIVSVPDLCPLSTLKADNLRKHMLVHSKEKPYICYACGKQFREPAKSKDIC